MMKGTNNRMLAALVVAALAMSGCLGLVQGDAPEPEAKPRNFEPSPTVVDMSGELPDTSVGVYGYGPFFNAGTVPSGEDDDATVLIEFQPNLGPVALGVSVCIDTRSGYQTQGTGNCDTYVYSTGDTVQLDATGLSGLTIFIGTDYGAGTGTTFVLCASVFDFHLPAHGYTAIVEGHCHDPAAVQRDAEPGGRIFDNETHEGEIPLTTQQAGLSALRSGPDEFEVAPGTRTLTLILSWKGSLDEEIKMRVYNRDDYDCQNDPANCPLHFVTTQNGEGTLTMSDPGAGTYDLGFFAETGVASGSYVIEVQHEIWPHAGPSGNAEAEADETGLPEGA